MKSIDLIFGCHSHQPVGNFDKVIESAYEQAYLPFFEVLERYPAVHITQHFSGPLLDWFETHRPEFLERLAALVGAGQVEIMGGGYYEPLLCATPERDSIAQIQRMKAFCKEHFGHAPRGMWLTERVWEPHMPRIMDRAGVEYTALDDTHFLSSGLTPDELFGYYVTEDEGHAIKVFPILKQLRYMIPFHQVFESILFLEENATEDGMRCAVIHDDGEKFGVWPETHGSVYGEGWLEEFFKALTDNKDWLHSVTYSEYLAKAPAIGRTYLPTASYEEMGEWVLPTPMHRRLKNVLRRIANEPEGSEIKDDLLFIRGGFWRGFLAKYAEANNMHKKMLRVSAKFDAIRDSGDSRVKEAERLLHMGQCNCAYWHGVFGGLYLNHLRTAVYEKLIAAELIIDGIRHGTAGWVSCETLDFDADGYDEAVLENANLSLGISAADGGTVFEWDYRCKPFNFGNTMTRREEVYHDALREGQVVVGDAAGQQSIHDIVRAKEEGLERHLVYDRYRRVSLRDHFLAENVTAEDLWACREVELADFATGVYAMNTTGNSVELTRRGTVVPVPGNPQTAALFDVRKAVALAPDASSFEIRYEVCQHDGPPASVLFGVEFCVNLLSGSSFDRYYRSDDRDLDYAKLGEMGREEGLSHIALRDDWQRLECGFRFDRPARVYRFAVETVSQSESGQERVYQGSVVIPCWQLSCQPGQPIVRTISAEVVCFNE